MAVGFSCFQSQPEMLCAGSIRYLFPKFHFPSLQFLLHIAPTPHTSRISQFCIHPTLLSHKLHFLLMGEEVNKKGLDGNYSFWSLGDGKGAAGMIHTRTVRLPSPLQCLNKEFQEKGQEHCRGLVWGNLTPCS